MQQKITVQTFFNEALSFYGDIHVFEKDGEKWVQNVGQCSYFPARRVSVEGDTVQFSYENGNTICSFHMGVFRELCLVLGFSSGTRLTSQLLEDALWNRYVDREKRAKTLIEDLVTTD